MNEFKDEFNPEEYICKVEFELCEFITNDTLTFKIFLDLRQKEVAFVFVNKLTDAVEEEVVFQMSDSDVIEILPFLLWEKYEMYRNLPQGWQWEFDNGFDSYRDGWGFDFKCSSANGDFNFETLMDVCFLEDKMPPYERLLSWVVNKYGNKKQLKNKSIFLE